MYPAGGAVRLPAVFTDHAVLQQGTPVPIWGWAEAGEAVTVTFAGQTRTAMAGADGRWMVQ
jgi:sialate O-acetylesterase